METTATFVGVRDLHDRVRKQDLLLFDEIAVPELEPLLSSIKDAGKRAEMEWLLERGAVSSFLLPETPIERGAESDLLMMAYAMGTLREIVDGLGESSLSKTITRLTNRGFFVAVTRMVASQIEHERHVRTAPLLPFSPSAYEWDLSTQITVARQELVEFQRSRTLKKALPKRTYKGLVKLCGNITNLMDSYTSRERTTLQHATVTEVTLRTLPMPDESVSWEQILEFRADERVRHHRLMLRRWMREVGKSDSSAIEIKEELEEMISSYAAHMRLHRMKTKPGVLRTMVTMGAQILKFDWSEAAKSLFTVRERKIALLEAEMSAPGREVAYIVDARETFRP